MVLGCRSQGRRFESRRAQQPGTEGNTTGEVQWSTSMAATVPARSEERDCHQQVHLCDVQQDEGSQVAALLLAEVAPIAIGEEWLDLCAGPGGKTALLAALQRPHNGFLVANEPHDHRAELVRNAVQPLREHVRVTTKDGRIVGRDNPSRFDRVLVDAPCSGLGALRRRPESRWRKSEHDLDALTLLQEELLTAAIRATKPGGYIAYVTCSPDTRETVDVVQTVLDEQPGVIVIKTVDVLSQFASHVKQVGRGTAVQLWPHRHGTDAMFIQLLQRTR